MRKYLGEVTDLFNLVPTVTEFKQKLEYSKLSTVKRRQSIDNDILAFLNTAPELVSNIDTLRLSSVRRNFLCFPFSKLVKSFPAFYYTYFSFPFFNISFLHLGCKLNKHTNKQANKQKGETAS